MAYEIKNAGLVFPQSRTKRSKTEGILIHHPAATNWTVKQVHDYHTNTNGWNGIGYNFYIHKDGTIYEGRGLEYQGAHCTAYNAKTIGICCQGDFEYVDASMSDAQYNALVWLIQYCQGIYGNGLYIKGHKEVSATACPGKNFPLEEVKKLQYRGDTTNTANTATVTSTGDSTIKSIQSTLNSRYGFNLDVDGIFGNLTKTALVKALQREIGTTADGIFGINTYTACGNKTNLKNGSSGKLVYILQATLYCLGFDCKGIDSDFGSNTQSAVKAYQQAKGLTVDGIAGKNTFAKLFGYK